MTLLKRRGMVREHRGGAWERLAEDVTKTDLSRELHDYEERREMDRRKVEAVIRYCRTAQCRTQVILEYFGEESRADFRCGHCDNDRFPAAENGNARRPGLQSPPSADIPAVEVEDEEFAPGEEVIHETFGKGIVLAMTMERAEVDFGGHGVRTIRADFLTRIG